MKAAQPGLPFGRRIGLVACSGSKLSTAAAARDLYTGQLFTMCRSWCERFCDEWAILSAKHQLVLPDQLLEPYDERLPLKAEALKRWCTMTNFSVRDRWCRAGYYPRPEADVYGGHPVMWDPTRPGMPTIVVLAGQDYRRAFTEADGGVEIPIDAPLAGLAIGKQLSWLHHQLAEVA